jgi:hypothetical protein
MNGGDVTRTTFRAPRHYSGVRMQQGRVQLDADWNEQIDIAAHRDRAEAVDVIGPVGTPKAAGGFALTLSPDGDDLLLSPGRAWVGGQLCELDSEWTAVLDMPSSKTATVGSVVLDGVELAPLEWVELFSTEDPDAVVVRIAGVDVATRTLTLESNVVKPGGDARLRRRASYAVQPDLPVPDHTAKASAAAPRVLDLPDGDYLAYLDVWERSITALEDATIVEPALGGPDTATRSRTVWQVRLLDVSDLSPVDCDTNISAAMATLAPVPGTMAARAEPPAGSVDLCRPTPAGGYVGLENHLYRIQVHDIIGDRPQIVWSRENASIATSCASASDTVLEVASTGRDAVLGIGSGDWVELFDDTCELQGLPGTLVKVQVPTGNQLKIDKTTATGPLSLASYPRNPRVRRWDSPGAVSAATDDWIELEDGVQVRFPQGGTYRRHDYWLVPARSATADIDWPHDSAESPLALGPNGIRHSSGRLAIVSVATGTIDIADCRDQFPALTALTAADVSVDNGVCLLPGAETVQDALDALCRANDLRRHNRLLHGYGIVCGLAVVCGDRTSIDDGRDLLRRLPGARLVPRRLPALAPRAEGEVRRYVTVEPGSAIDPGGNDIDISKPVVVDILKAIDGLEDEVLDDGGDGEVMLVLRTDPDRGQQIAAVPYKAPEPNALSFLEGTLLWDIYDDCIADLQNWIKARLTPTEGADPVESQDAYLLRTALTNLASYYVNPGSGGDVFVSENEDKLLRSFYEGLRKRLASQTFCAMFDDARPYPDYPDGLRGITTIAGLGWHSRARMHPGGEEVYTVGAGVNPVRPTALINRYNLAKGCLVSRIDPVAGMELKPGDKPSVTSGPVTDVAFSPDGRQIYAAVPTRDENDTMFIVGDIAGDKVKWGASTTICGVKLVTLATTPADPGSVYAVGMRRLEADSDGWSPREYTGAGIFKINVADVPDQLAPIAGTEGLNTVGHLVITEDGQAVFTCGSPGESAESYNQLVAMTVPDGQQTAVAAIESGSDDIAFVPDGETGAIRLWAVVGSGDSRALVGFDLSDLSSISGRIAIEQPNGVISLQAVFTRLALAESNATTLRVFEPRAGFTRVRLPVQVSPVALAATFRRPRSLVALNLVSNSLSVIDPKIVMSESFDLSPLMTYRRAAVESFADLIYGFAQYLKDCVCHHMLVNCPETPEVNDLDLAVVSIRGKSVYKVCNFSGRRYVKSFPTVGYWLSLVPVIPFLKEKLVQLCCQVLADRFGAYKTDAHDDAEDRVSAQSILSFLNLTQAEDPLTMLRSGTQTLKASRTMAAEGNWHAATDHIRSAVVAPAVRSALRTADAPSVAAQPSDEVVELRKRIDSLEEQVRTLTPPTKRRAAKKTT